MAALSPAQENAVSLWLAIFLAALLALSLVGVITSPPDTKLIRGLRRAATGTAHAARIAWPIVRRIAAGAVVGGWVGINAYWFVAGEHPVCQVTTVSQPGMPAKTTVTQTCGLPDATVYVGVFAFVGLLLYPDAKSITLLGVGIERLRKEVEPVAKMAREARAGDTTAGSVSALDAIQARFGPGP